MSQLRDEAEALATALEIGACDVAEVIAWSDVQLLREDSPPVPLCEISLSQDCYRQDMAAFLRQLPGDPDRSRVERLLVTLIDARLKGHRGRAYQIASALSQLVLADAIADPQLSEIGRWASDALDLADAGHIAETRDQVIDQLAAALGRVAAESGVTSSVGIG